MKVEDYQENYITGWTKLYRSFIKWEWFTVPNMVHVFIYCLLKANHKDKNYRGTLIKRGCFVTSREQIAIETGLSTQQVRTCLKKLKLTNDLTIKTSRKGTHIQIVNYNVYQNSTNNLTKNQPETNQKLTTNNNVNKDNNSSISVETVEIWIKETGKDKIYLEGVYRTYGLEQGSVSKLLNNFNNHLKANPKQHRNKRDFQNHFYNWLGIKDRNGTLSEFKKRTKGML